MHCIQLPLLWIWSLQLESQRLARYFSVEREIIDQCLRIHYVDRRVGAMFMQVNRLNDALVILQLYTKYLSLFLTNLLEHCERISTIIGGNASVDVLVEFNSAQLISMRCICS